MSAFTDDRRGRMNLLYRRLREGTQVLFWWDGLGYWGVPSWVVKAYVAARFGGRLELGAVCIAAHLGVETTQLHGKDAGWAGWMIGRAWAGKLAEVEAAIPKASAPIAAATGRAAP